MVSLKGFYVKTSTEIGLNFRGHRGLGKVLFRSRRCEGWSKES